MRPELAEIFAHLRQQPDAGVDPIAAMRSMVEGYAMGCAGEGMATCRMVPTRIGDLAAEWLVPPAPGDGRIVYCHGGGWVAGSLNSHRTLAAELAHLSGFPVLVPDYRLAPEHPFPAGLIDCAQALAHAAQHGPDGPGACGALALAGDSAGGNLAAALALGLAPMADVPRPDRLVLFSPFLALEPLEAGFSRPADDPAVEGDGMALVATLYAPDHNLSDPAISPLRAEDSALAQLPPTLILASTAETLRGQALVFAQRAWGQGATVRLSLWPDLPHVWPIFMGKLPEADLALREAAAFLRGQSRA
ncbi:alpha/beta hydrolase [Erythrobacter sp. BLCC-B19]|uniref:alpha/beta hydrolase n=1 Tax=Erythrobacter sp. BLCC-B19 TaxID=3025315 RepID=UPI00235FB487|nr:alpha/beta hydrolase fold domain-containing protein [Erythrobacter sp. BLCC-B19]WDA40597.1 alpha/beta hydrolase fold domain-containing protein [Erythrobacter sp. BLCC-B19]